MALLELTEEERKSCENAKQRFMQLWEKYVENKDSTEQPRLGASEMMDWLEYTDFFTAPASTKYHGAFPGGLAWHSVAVAEETLRLLDLYGAPTNRGSAVLCALLHDVCKADYYKEGTKRQKGQDGEWREVRTYTVQDQLPLGHAEKSIYIVQKNIALTDAEAVAIRWHMGAYCDQQQYSTMGQAYDSNPLALFLHLADMIDAHYLPF